MNALKTKYLNTVKMEILCYAYFTTVKKNTKKIKRRFCGLKILCDSHLRVRVTCSFSRAALDLPQQRQVVAAELEEAGSQRRLPPSPLQKSLEPVPGPTETGSLCGHRVRVLGL